MSYARLRIATAISTATLALGLLAPAAHAQMTPSFGDLLKLPSDGNPETTADAAVYYFGADGKRYVFPTEKTYKTWYPDYSTVKTTTPEILAGIPIGGNVTYRAGIRLVKITTDPKVYAVSKNGILRPVTSEAVATALFGANWNQQIDDLPDPFFVNYRVGSTIGLASDYNRAGVTAAAPNIGVDKLLLPPPYGHVDIRSNIGFTPSEITVAKGTAVTWISLDNSVPTVASDPHPTHTDIPNFQTTTLQMGQSWSFTFNQSGTFNYHNHNFPDERGKVIVTP